MLFFLSEEGTAHAGNAHPSHVDLRCRRFSSSATARCASSPNTSASRTPAHGIFGLSYTVSMGQWLSLPMIAAGVAMLVWSKKAAAKQLYGMAIASSIRKTHPGPTESRPQEKSASVIRRVVRSVEAFDSIQSVGEQVNFFRCSAGAGVVSKSRLDRFRPGTVIPGPRSGTRNPVPLFERSWIPAFAGMTARGRKRNPKSPLTTPA